jgi:pyrroline-5-carboxylate reductase
MKIGIIGLGRLGAALARGLDRAGHAGGLYGYNRGAAKAQAVTVQAPTLQLCAAEADVLRQCELVFLWTKPEDALRVLEANRELIQEQRPLIITCVIGLPLATFTDRWAECYPNVNMPALKGVTALNYAPTMEESDRRLAHDVLGKVGSVYVLSAEEIHFYSALCSCGPALYATMLELLADTLAARRRYDREQCRRMVRETMLGTILLQELDQVDAAEVVQRVAHPGGPSEAGVAHLRTTLPALYEAMFQKMRKW